MRRIVTWFLSTVSVVVLLFGYHTSTAGSLATPATTVAVPGATSRAATSGNDASGQASAGRSPGGTAGSSSGTRGVTATVTGRTVLTQWGPVQVQVTLDSGRITDVTVLQYPDGNSTDQQIAAYSLPVLVQETLDAQSADIDMVSGATYTSTGYQQSLQSALDQAGVR